ncbi:MAG: EAL domain-containing protein [Methylobacter sp.]|nr:MAG: EAL domain-containing protein [Methylobacter sp.]
MKINSLQLLQRMKIWQLWLFSVILSMLLTEAVVAVMGLALKGTVPFDYLLTGLLASFFVASLIVAMFGYFLEKLLESQLQLRAIIEAEPECVKLVAVDGTLLQVNRAGLNMIEADSSDQIVGQHITQFMTPEYRDAFMALTKRVFEGESGNLKFEMHGLKGSHRWMDAHTVPLRDAHGHITALLAVTRDITEHKAAETARQEALDRLQKIASRVPGLVFQFQMRPDGSYCFPFASEAIRDIYRVSPEDVRDDASKVFAILHPDDYDSVVASIKASARNLIPWHYEYRVMFGDGTVRWLFGNSLPQREIDGSVLWHGFITDVTERKRATTALLESEARFRTMADSAPVLIWIASPDKFFHYFNKGWLEFTGRTMEQEVGNGWIENVHPEDFQRCFETYVSSFDARREFSMEYRLRRFDGEYRWLLDHGVPLYDEQETFLGYIGSCIDITRRKLAETDLRIASTAFESQEAMAITDKNQVILRVNQAFVRVTGYSVEEVVGKTPALLKSGRQDAEFYQAMWESLSNDGHWQGEIWNRRKNGEVYPEWLNITAVTDERGRVTNYVASFSDITERKTAEYEIQHLAFYDPLTQLPNRRLLQERLKHGIDVERREGKQLALLMLDLDRFKAVNDSLGHQAGDALLQQVATRITSRLREVDMVARLGGDEFIVLLEDISHPDDAARVAEEIIASLSKPFQLIQSDDVRIGASIGIGLYPQHGDSAEILLDHADAALYHAKDQGRGCFAYFSEDLTIAVRERIALEVRLRKAIEQEELRVFYQAQTDIASGRIVGAEALVRWLDPVEGLIPPVRFIPIAEETKLIVEIGEWVLRETCRQGRQWLDMGLPPLTLAVNVSPQQFRRSDINALVATVLQDTGFPARQLELEITESGLMENHDKTTHILNSLHAQGIHLAIDDFGTGYSSLTYLKHFPLDVLKIDKSFIDDIPHNKDDMEIASTIVAIGHTLGFKVLAEGVETLEQLAFLQAQNCDLYQGYLKSRPLPADEFVILLQADEAFHKNN